MFKRGTAGFKLTLDELNLEVFVFRLLDQL